MALPLTATALSPSLPAQVSLSENAFNSKKQLLKQERKAAKLAARAALPVHVVVEPIMFLPREWRYLETQASERKSRKVSIMTWNVSACTSLDISRASCTGGQETDDGNRLW